ncbi:hypothetical protein MG293_013482 [Ovis ammon polii]|uniref:Transforming acidic coiled-coil-containing protein C-terminal domain-containing protein n=1 Tax=Ovis ammon polii TaxID=230172 RepID=A0AAD4U2Q9_OVIAM|nr:hypothetical protein MG293_013482 [Ovis ammon polii]
MSLHIFSDESVTGDKSAENCDFLFSPPELTGRSSVLRLSQKENVPPKSTDKAVKKENQQFTKETDTKTTHGILQKPVLVNAEPPSEDMRPASEDQPPGGPPSASLISLGPSSSSQIPESVENPDASRGPAPSSPECAGKSTSTLGPRRRACPLAPRLQNSPPGWCPRTQQRTCSALSEGVPGPLAGPASPFGTHPGEKPLVDLPEAAPAGSMDATGHEDMALTSPGEAAGATHPSAQGEDRGQATGSLRSEPVWLEFDFSDATSKSVEVPSSGSPQRPSCLTWTSQEPRAAGLAPCDLGPGAPLLPVGPIVDVLQYSQKNLDSAVEATQKENEVLRGKCAALQERLLEMGKIMDSFEGTVYQVMEESQKQKELAKAEMQKVLKEKVQLMADLHSMEKSFSDLFKRFEKQKENKESLKKCVKD